MRLQRGRRRRHIRQGFAGCAFAQEGTMKEKSTLKKRAAFLGFEYLEGSLDTKTRELVLLAGAAVAGCRH
jgi:alkylhydroperoxidase/carboxymuconolactone decarboxylase family protein YurZ